MRLGKIPPGWYLLLVLSIYAVVITFLWRNSLNNDSELNVATKEPVVTAVDRLEPKQGMWFPIPGAHLPDRDYYLPGSLRNYRSGVNQGFDFYADTAGIPIVYGTPVIAAQGGIVIRADHDFQETSEEDWLTLMNEVSKREASEQELNILRGRQIWIRTNDGRILRYAHLSGIDDDIDIETEVYRGQVIGFVGNSGTDDGVKGTTRGARLHFEIWEPSGSFFGQGKSLDEIRAMANSLFVGP